MHVNTNYIYIYTYIYKLYTGTYIYIYIWNKSTPIYLSIYLSIIYLSIYMYVCIYVCIYMYMHYILIQDALPFITITFLWQLLHWPHPSVCSGAPVSMRPLWR